MAIRIFGGLRLEKRGAPFARPQRRASERLLIYLLLHRGRQLDRSAAAFELWPDVTAEKARTNLRFHLYKLTAWLPETPPDRPWIVRDDRNVGWSLDADAWLDAAEFEARTAAASAGTLDTDGTFKALKVATELYVGDIVPDFDEPWLDGPRAAMRAAAIGALDALVDALLARRHGSEAVTTAQRRLALDPYAEHGYRQLMRAHAGMPDVGALARTLDECTAALREGYGLDPSPETTALYNALLGGEAAPSAGVAASTVAMASVAVDAGTTVSEQSAASPSQRLPVPFTRFVGRADELVDLRRLLGEFRLLTILGPGGAGKTRLALETLRPLATTAGTRVCWVDLAELPRGAPIAPAVADSILPEAKSVASIDDLAALVGDDALILALDNCEHVIEGARETADALLMACSGLRIVATSREPLSIPGERRWPIAPLAVPDVAEDSPAAIERSAAVEMFVDRAAALDAMWRPSPEDMRHVASICRRLDGQPLAIEIAAARTLLLSLGDLDAQLAASLRALEPAPTGPPSPSAEAPAALRHDSLSASVGWSYRLLGSDEQAALARLSAIPGSFDLAAAAAIIAGPPLPDNGAFGLVARLVEKSLIGIVPQSGPSRRFRLPQPVIDYLEEVLPAGERSEWRMRMAEHFKERAHEARLAAGEHGLTRAIIASLQEDHLNFDVALSTLVEGGEIDAALVLANGLSYYWSARGHLRYAAERLTALAIEGEKYAPTPSLARASMVGALYLHWLGDFERARLRYDVAIEQYQAVGDTNGCVLALTLRAETLVALLDLDAAEATLNDAWRGAMKIDDIADRQRIEAVRAELEYHLGQYATAHSRLIGILSYVTATAPDSSVERSIRLRLAHIALDIADYDAALADIALAQSNAEASGDHATIARAEHLRGIVLAEMGDVEGAHAAFRQAIDSYRRQGTPTMTSWVVHYMGELALQQGQYDVAETYLQHSLDAKKRTRDRIGLVYAHLGRSELSLCRSNWSEAQAEVERAFAILATGSDPRMHAWARLMRAHVRAAAADPDGALADADAALAFTVHATQRRRAALALEARGVACAAGGRWHDAVRAMAAGRAVWTAIAVDPTIFSRLAHERVSTAVGANLGVAAIAAAVAAGDVEGRMLADEMRRRIEGWRSA